MDLALNNLQRLICHKTNKPTKPTICLFDQVGAEKLQIFFKKKHLPSSFMYTLTDR